LRRLRIQRDGYCASLKECEHMADYRAYAVWPDGNFVGFEVLICPDDEAAIGRARLLAKSSAIELWTGERFVTRLERKST
jgi:hypothetical protein